ncbi:hypothetical protein DEO72_LG8g1617 [Vigna unguiculata]|uniref:Uncharacterized protein n=1 Tax=Vigna unguiculata TaxID=3917 RepID=A0A4D6MSJ0_VIGUN|nr:hypothetical protein DEO72_LG8g1617 [Vigna unguiculata]
MLKRTIYVDPFILATTSTLTPAHSPTRAQLKGSLCPSAIPSSTRGMSFRAQLEECHVLNPYPELNSRDTFRATTQGTTTNQPLKHHYSIVDHAHQGKRITHLLQHHRLAQPMRHQAQQASKPPGGGRVSSGIRRLRKCHYYRHRLVGLPSPLGARKVPDPLHIASRLAG